MKKRQHAAASERLARAEETLERDRTQLALQVDALRRAEQENARTAERLQAAEADVKCRADQLHAEHDEWTRGRAAAEKELSEQLAAARVRACRASSSSASSSSSSSWCSLGSILA
jgi:hypothetical protein